MMSTLFFVILVAVAWTVIKLKLKRDRSLVARSSKYGLIRVKYRLFSKDGGHVVVSKQISKSILELNCFLIYKRSFAVRNLRSC